MNAEIAEVDEVKKRPRLRGPVIGFGALLVVIACVTLLIQGWRSPTDGALTAQTPVNEARSYMSSLVEDGMSVEKVLDVLDELELEHSGELIVDDRLAKHGEARYIPAMVRPGSQTKGLVKRELQLTFYFDEQTSSPDSKSTRSSPVPSRSNQ